MWNLGCIMLDLLLRSMDSLIVARGLQSAQASVVALHGFNYSMACGILVPRPGIEPVYPALQGGILTAGPPGKFLSLFSWSDPISAFGSQKTKYVCPYLLARSGGPTSGEG